MVKNNDLVLFSVVLNAAQQYLHFLYYHSSYNCSRTVDYPNLIGTKVGSDNQTILKHSRPTSVCSCMTYINKKSIDKEMVHKYLITKWFGETLSLFILIIRL